jgi:hypothetical protein
VFLLRVLKIYFKEINNIKLLIIVVLLMERQRIEKCTKEGPKRNSD